jgi:hypothetical protein
MAQLGRTYLWYGGLAQAKWREYSSQEADEGMAKDSHVLCLGVLGVMESGMIVLAPVRVPVLVYLYHSLTRFQSKRFTG